MKEEIMHSLYNINSKLCGPGYSWSAVKNVKWLKLKQFHFQPNDSQQDKEILSAFHNCVLMVRAHNCGSDVSHFGYILRLKMYKILKWGSLLHSYVKYNK